MSEGRFDPGEGDGRLSEDGARFDAYRGTRMLSAGSEAFGSGGLADSLATALQVKYELSGR